MYLYSSILRDPGRLQAPRGAWHAMGRLQLSGLPAVKPDGERMPAPPADAPPRSTNWAIARAYNLALAFGGDLCSANGLG